MNVTWRLPKAASTGTTCLSCQMVFARASDSVYYWRLTASRSRVGSTLELSADALADVQRYKRALQSHFAPQSPPLEVVFMDCNTFTKGAKHAHIQVFAVATGQGAAIATTIVQYAAAHNMKFDSVDDDWQRHAAGSEYCVMELPVNYRARPYALGGGGGDEDTEEDKQGQFTPGSAGQRWAQGKRVGEGACWRHAPIVVHPAQPHSALRISGAFSVGPSTSGAPVNCVYSNIMLRLPFKLAVARYSPWSSALFHHATASALSEKASGEPVHNKVPNFN